jgi:hypothetical protein
MDRKLKSLFYDYKRKRQMKPFEDGSVVDLYFDGADGVQLLDGSSGEMASIY